MTYQEPINETAITDMMVHAAHTYPKECCGLVIGGNYVECENIASGDDEFEIDDTIMAAHWDKIDAVVHSHCFSGREAPPRGSVRIYGPSHADMVQQIASGHTWGIVPVMEGLPVNPYFWGDRLEPAPLIGREFIHGVWDCLATIRDYARLELGQPFPNFPRQFGWWRKLTSGGLYVENMRKAGYKRIAMEEALPNDILVGALESRVLNHAGIILPDTPENGIGMMLHHWIDELSRRAPIGLYHDTMTTVLRYVGTDSDDA